MVKLENRVETLRYFINDLYQALTDGKQKFRAHTSGYDNEFYEIPMMPIHGLKPSTGQASCSKKCCVIV